MSARAALPIAELRAPLFVSWQITHDCDLCCLHCCTESAPGKRLHDELDAEAALRVADQIVANDVPYGLSSAIYTRDVNAAFQAMRDLYTGIVYVNAPTIGAEIPLPFGGTKHTGNGFREAGARGIEQFSQLKTVYIDYSGRLQRAQIDTPKADSQ